MDERVIFADVWFCPVCRGEFNKEGYYEHLEEQPECKPKQVQEKESES